MGLLTNPIPKILQINIMRIIWQTVKRITSEILGVKGLISGDKNNSFTILRFLYFSQ